MATSRGQLGDPQDPHAGQTTLGAGPTPEAAAATLVLVHGRGGSAADILSLYTELRLPDLAALARPAAGNPCYPGMPHTVTQDELDATRSLLERVLSREKGGHP